MCGSEAQVKFALQSDLDGDPFGTTLSEVEGGNKGDLPRNATNVFSNISRASNEIPTEDLLCGVFPLPVQVEPIEGQTNGDEGSAK